VLWFIDTHPFVIDFRNENEYTPQKIHQEVELWDENHYLETRTSTYRSLGFSPVSESTRMEVDGSNDPYMLAWDSHLTPMKEYNTNFSDAKDVGHAYSRPKRQKERQDDDQEQNFLSTRNLTGRTIKTIDFSKVYPSPRPEYENQA